MSTPVASGPEVPLQTLREVAEHVAPIVRPPCSPGEREAAAWIAHRLRAAGCHDVREEVEDAWGAFPPMLTGIGLMAMAASWQTQRGRRALGSAGAVLALAALLDEIQNGPRIFRRLVRRRKSTVNVVATAGDPDGPATLVALAHHDAPQTGHVFDQTWAKVLHRRAPGVLAGGETQIPQWWLGVAPPALTLAGALTKRRSLPRAGAVVAAIATAAVADIARSPTVPGANDNLSGVAALVALAEMLNERPMPGVRVMLVSCGAEESFQEGIRAFIARHGDELDAGSTSVLNFETLGSEHLVMIEGEGPVWMENYSGPTWRDGIAAAAERLGIPLRRGIRVRASTDSIIASRAGYPTATLFSLMPWGMPLNYHLMSDVPEALHYDTIADAVRVAYASAASLAGAF